MGATAIAVRLSAIPLSLQPLTHSLSLVQLAAAYGVATILSPLARLLFYTASCDAVFVADLSSIS
ncbi:MAG: hypothetical protein IJJ71_00385 [Treponema sp.]|uniref:hypothetical protein n=1 Tax=Treponema sp. TaxID=166 RepID=UPI0025EFB956|nr:hypothetical protein [Treponema sp.]MBQ9622518.1 hypothetical protein [Treponema sp.]MBR0494616.1 hypothetical protein [Treponema sp.]